MSEKRALTNEAIHELLAERSSSLCLPGSSGFVRRSPFVILGGAVGSIFLQ